MSACCIGLQICKLQVLSGSHKNLGDFLSDICDGSICDTNSILRDNDVALQIIGYYDELTITNPLMSTRAKKNKIGIHEYETLLLLNVYLIIVGAVYFTIANIDPAVRSRLESINFVALFKSQLLQEYSFDDVLKPFVDDLKKLSSVCSYTCLLYT